MYLYDEGCHDIHLAMQSDVLCFDELRLGLGDSQRTKRKPLDAVLLIASFSQTGENFGGPESLLRTWLCGPVCNPST